MLIKEWYATKSRTLELVGNYDRCFPTKSKQITMIDGFFSESTVKRSAIKVMFLSLSLIMIGDIDEY